MSAAPGPQAAPVSPATGVPPNPYVGPRAFRTGEPLFGRTREVRELTELLIAERVVLLCSPSGAGKTSLVRAGLVPRLRDDERFRVLPAPEGEHTVVRVSTVPPWAPGAGAAVNRYVLSVLLSLEEGQPPGLRLEPGELSGLGLREYLAKRAPPADA